MSRNSVHFYKRQKARRRAAKERAPVRDTDAKCKPQPQKAKTGEGGE